MAIEYGYKSLGVRRCPTCGKSFEASTRKPKQVFCSVKCSKTGINNPSYKKNNEVGLSRLHRRIESIIGRPDRCSLCGSIGSVDLANISNEYKSDTSDWEWLCRKCHMDKDGRNEVLKMYNERRRIKPRNCPICQKSFTPDRNSTKHCSVSCATIMQHREGKIKSRKGIKNKSRKQPS